MKARTKQGAAVAALVFSGVALAACSAPPDRSRPQVPPSPDPHIQRVGTAPVDPRFDSAIAAYKSDISTLDRGAEDVEIRRSLRLLAVALEAAPYTDGVDLARTSTLVRGGRVRELRGRAVLSGPVDASPTLQTDRGLTAVADALVELARGPYRAAPGLIEHAYAVDEAARTASGSSTEGSCRRAAVNGLRHAATALQVMRDAVARGDVGPSPSPATNTLPLLAR